MSVGVAQEALPFVWVKLHRLRTGQTVPYTGIDLAHDRLLLHLVPRMHKRPGRVMSPAPGGCPNLPRMSEFPPPVRWTTHAQGVLLAQYFPRIEPLIPQSLPTRSDRCFQALGVLPPCWREVRVRLVRVFDQRLTRL